LSKH